LNLKLKLELQQSPMFRAIQHNCARSYVWTMAALATGVERKADMVCLQEPPREREGVGISHPAYDIRKRKRVRTVVRKRSSFATNERTDLSKNALGDVIVVDINRRGEKMTRIVNIYDQKEGETGERQVRKLNWQRIIRQGGGGTVLAGDFNARSQRRDPRCTEGRDVTYWEEIIDEDGLVIGNDHRPTHYWTRHDSMGESVIDLTMAN
jgi:hypothetical protein